MVSPGEKKRRGCLFVHASSPTFPHPLVRSILAENRLGECGGRHVATLVENAPCLRVLRLEDGGLGDEGVAHLCKGLQSASCLVELTLAGM